MFCPRCGQEQVSMEIRFCSRCGFLMSGVGELVANDGNTSLISTAAPKPDSPRKRGLKQGFFFFLLTFLVVPIISILTVWANAEPYAVVIASIIFFVGGVLRMAYAMLFESIHPNEKTIERTVYQTAQGLLNKKLHQTALPASQSIPVENYIPPKQANWRETNDLAPNSVTDGTTKLLDNERRES